MAKKRPRKRPRKEGHRRPPQDEPRPLFPPGFYDRRAIEGVMWSGVAAKLGGEVDDSPLARAQELVYQAFARPDPAERIRMARQALEISPDCADAYVILAEHARSAQETIEFYRRGVAAGERALGPETFQEQVGHFWGVLDTRPYMRAREGLAHALWSACRGDEAIAHLREMLRLNPGDNQGLRYTVVPWLLSLERDDEAEAFLDEHPGAEGNLGFTRAFIAFRREGDSPEGRQWLKRGDEQNRFIAPWLLGDEPFPSEAPEGYTPGSPEEAYIYVRAMRCAWRSTPGAIAWVRRTLASPVGSSGSATGTFRPAAADRGRLGRLPMSYETWQVGFRPLPTRLKKDEDLVVPWVILVASQTAGQILWSIILEEEPRASQLWDAIARAIERPLTGESQRPSGLEVWPDPRWDQLRPHLDDVGIALRDVETLDVLDDLFEDLIQHLLRDEPPGLLDSPRVTPAAVGSLFRAAADFYRKAPWRILGDRYGIRVECPRFQSGPWAAVVMGQAGMTLGLALYERLDHVRAMWAREPDPHDELVRRVTCLGVTFDREFLARPKDAFAAAKYGWEVVDPETFPDIDRKEPGMHIRPPLSWEQILLEGCLRAIPAFLVRYAPGDPVRSKMTVPVATGELDLVLSWIDDASDDEARSSNA